MITLSNNGPFIKEDENEKLENKKVEVKVDKNKEKKEKNKCIPRGVMFPNNPTIIISSSPFPHT